MLEAAEAKLAKGSSSKKKKKAASSKKSKSKKGKKKKASSSSGSSSASSSGSALFAVAPPRDGVRGLVQVHEKSPGSLYDSAVAQLAEQMGARGGAKNPENAVQWVQYLQSVLQQQCASGDMPPERLQELRTLCEALNLAGRGRIRGLCDVLTQRFCAVEQKALGQRELSRGLELVHQNRHGLSASGTLAKANKAVAAELKLKESAERLRRGGGR